MQRKREISKTQEILKESRVKYGNEEYLRMFNNIDGVKRYRKLTRLSTIIICICFAIMIFLGILNKKIFHLPWIWVAILVLFGISYLVFVGPFKKGVELQDIEAAKFFEALFEEEKFSEIDELEEKIATYTGYLDGIEVDLRKVDYRLYDYSVDDEKQIVFLTHKTN